MHKLTEKAPTIVGGRGQWCEDEIVIHDDLQPELKPCPMCGSDAKLMGSIFIRNGNYRSYVVCTNGECSCRLTAHTLGDITNKKEADTKAAALWNKRTSARSKLQ